MNLPSLTRNFPYGEIIIAAVLFSAYVITLLPGPGYTGDTAKFQFVGSVLGTPHETGYPAYVLLNYIFTGLVPFGSLAGKSNFLSALLSVGAALLLYATLRRMNLTMWISLATTLTFGTGYTVWSQSIVAEVYSLNILFVALVTYYALRWHDERKERFFFLTCGFYAFSFGNHLTMITFLPAIVYWVWVSDRRAFVDSRKILFVFLLIVLSAFQYGYILWRTTNPSTPYVEMSATNLVSLWEGVSGGRFSHLFFGLSLSWMVFERLPALLMFMFRELLFLLPFIVAGMLSFRNKHRRLFLLLAIAGNILFCLGYAIYDIFVYLIPSYFFLAIFAAVGLENLSSALKSRITIFRPAFVLAIPLITLLMNYVPVNRKNDTVENEKALKILEIVRENSVLVCPDYHFAMIFWYHVLTQEWKDRNIHVAFYHDQKFPSSASADYILRNKIWFVPVTGDSIPPGLKVYVFLESFPLDVDRLPGIRKDSLSVRMPSDVGEVRRHEQLKKAGLKSTKVFDSLFLVQSRDD